jgi:hypothetical protein
MHVRLSFAVLVFLTLACAQPDKAWQDAKEKLERIREQDQRYRKQMDSIGRVEGWQSEAIERLYDEQRKLDSVNLAEVEAIIDRLGYPSKDRVGDLAIVPFDVIQHSGDSVMINYLEVIVGAAANGDIPKSQAAIFHDRTLIAQRQPQEYGTQIWIDFIEDKKTGERHDSVYLWPVRNLSTVDERRMGAGLDSLAVHLRRYNIDPARGYLVKKSGGSAR